MLDGQEDSDMKEMSCIRDSAINYEFVVIFFCLTSRLISVLLNLPDTFNNPK